MDFYDQNVKNTSNNLDGSQKKDGDSSRLNVLSNSVISSGVQTAKHGLEKAKKGLKSAKKRLDNAGKSVKKAVSTLKDVDLKEVKTNLLTGKNLIFMVVGLLTLLLIIAIISVVSISSKNRKKASQITLPVVQKVEDLAGGRAFNDMVKSEREAGAGIESGVSVVSSDVADGGSFDVSAAVPAYSAVISVSSVSGEAAILEDVPSIADNSFSITSAEVFESTVEAANPSVSVEGLIPLSKINYTQYAVKAGDSVKSIADSFGLRTQTVIQVNSLKTVYPDEGTVLNIPNIDGQIYKVQKGDSVFSIVQKFSLSISWNTFKLLNGLESDELKEGELLFVPYAGATDDDFFQDENSGEEMFSSPVRDAGLLAGFSVATKDPLTGESVVLDGVLLQTGRTSDVYVSSVGSVVDKGFNPNGTYFVKVSHKNGYTSYYDYLTWTKVKVGDRLMNGESLGTISAGNTILERPTLFFRIEQDGISLDPASFFDLGR